MPPPNPSSFTASPMRLNAVLNSHHSYYQNSEPVVRSIEQPSTPRPSSLAPTSIAASSPERFISEQRWPQSETPTARNSTPVARRTKSATPRTGRGNSLTRAQQATLMNIMYERHATYGLPGNKTKWWAEIADVLEIAIGKRYISSEFLMKKIRTEWEEADAPPTGGDSPNDGWFQAGEQWFKGFWYQWQEDQDAKAGLTDKAKKRADGVEAQKSSLGETLSGKRSLREFRENDEAGWLSEETSGPEGSYIDCTDGDGTQTDTSRPAKVKKRGWHSRDQRDGVKKQRAAERLVEQREKRRDEVDEKIGRMADVVADAIAVQQETQIQPNLTRLDQLEMKLDEGQRNTDARLDAIFALLQGRPGGVV